MLPTILREIDGRLRAEATEAAAAELWTATYLLAGLRYTEEVSEPLFRSVRAMRESATYQAILAEGEVRGEVRGEAWGEARGEARGKLEEARRLLLLLGGQRFGEPDALTRRRLARLQDLARIERMTTRLLQAQAWDDLLATP